MNRIAANPHLVGWSGRATNGHFARPTTLDTAAGQWFAWRNEDGLAVIGRKPFCSREAIIGCYPVRQGAVEAAQAANAERNGASSEAGDE